jgi:hypothetical protein
MSPLTYGLLADLVVLLHAGFVLFVVFGGLLVWRWGGLAWVHLPAAAWGVAIEWSGAICPLTPLENRFRGFAGEETYAGDFVARYVMPILYPAGLTRTAQVVLGMLAIAINVAVYTRLLSRRREEQIRGVGRR